MSKAILKSESILTDRYQTTIPEVVRKALHLGKRDKIHYRVQSNGNVLISRVENETEDPAIVEFLNFLATDIQRSAEKRGRKFQCERKPGTYK